MTPHHDDDINDHAEHPGGILGKKSLFDLKMPCVRFLPYTFEDRLKITTNLLVNDLAVYLVQSEERGRHYFLEVCKILEERLGKLHADRDEVPDRLRVLEAVVRCVSGGAADTPTEIQLDSLAAGFDKYVRRVNSSHADIVIACMTNVFYRGRLTYTSGNISDIKAITGAMDANLNVLHKFPDRNYYGDYPINNLLRSAIEIDFMFLCDCQHRTLLNSLID